MSTLFTVGEQGPVRVEMYSDFRGGAHGRCPVHGETFLGDTQSLVVSGPDEVHRASLEWAKAHAFCGSPAALAEVASSRRHPGKSRRRVGCSA